MKPPPSKGGTRPGYHQYIAEPLPALRKIKSAPEPRHYRGEACWDQTSVPSYVLRKSTFDLDTFRTSGTHLVARRRTIVTAGRAGIHTTSLTLHYHRTTLLRFVTQPRAAAQWYKFCSLILRFGKVHDQTAIQAFKMVEFPRCGTRSASEHRNAADWAGFCRRLNTGRYRAHVPDLG
jgi:hypothetical protein